MVASWLSHFHTLLPEQRLVPRNWNSSNFEAFKIVKFKQSEFFEREQKCDFFLMFWEENVVSIFSLKLIKFCIALQNNTLW